jgi:hypothetical protein
MRMRLLVWSLGVAACGHTSPAGTVVADWTYASTDDAGPPAPQSKRPPQTIAADEDWPVAGAAPVKLHFETEIGDYAGQDGTRWNWPRRVRITLAEPTKVELPKVDCMPGPPGNKVENGKLVRPLGKDGVPKGLVACFVNGKLKQSSYVYDIDGEGKITRSVPAHQARSARNSTLAATSPA